MSGRARNRVFIALAAVFGALALLLWLRRDAPRSQRSSATEDRTAQPSRSPVAHRARGGPPPVGPADVRLEGRVLDLADAGVPGAEVRLASRSVTASAITDDQGGFAFDALPPDVYFVDAATADAACPPRRVVLRADTPPLLLRLSPAIRAEVTVVDRTTDQPVEDAVVEVLDRFSDTPFRSGVTGSDGKVALRGMPPDGYAVTVSAPGYRTAVEPFPPRAGLRWTMTVRLAPGVAVRGRVVDQEDGPVEMATILPMAPAEALFVATPRLASHTVLSGAGGEFTITLDPGRFRLIATHPRYLKGSSEVFTVADRPVDGVVIRVDRGGSINGTVVRADGSPAPYATVRSSASARHDLGTGMRQTLTDGNGRFTIEGLPRVPIELVATTPAATSDNVAVDLTAEPNAEDVTVTLGFDGEISGVVTGSDGQPIEGAQVYCVGLPHGAVGTRPIFAETSDASGRFTCRGLVPGDFSLTATRPYPNNNQGPSMRSVTVQGIMTGTTDVSLVLPQDGALTGQIRLPDGSAPARFGVSVDNSGLPREFENTDGRFVLDGLAPRTYQVRLTADGFIPRIVPGVRVPEGDRVDIGPVVLAPVSLPPEQ